MRRKLYLLSLIFTVLIVLTGCTSASSSNDETIILLSEAVEKIEKADNYTYSGSNKYEGAIYANVDDIINGKKMSKGGTFYNLIKTENENTRINGGYTNVTILKNKPKDDYNMLIFATESPEGLLLQHIIPDNSTVTSSDIAYSKNSVMTMLQNNFYFQEERMSDFFDINLKKEDKNKVITIKVKDTKKLDEEKIKDGKKEDPNYDPYTIFGNKVSKNEIKKYEVEFMLDQDNNLSSQKVIMQIDYGDGLKYNSKIVMNYSDINSTKLDTGAIDALCTLCDQTEDFRTLLATPTVVDTIN